MSKEVHQSERQPKKNLLKRGIWRARASLGWNWGNPNVKVLTIDQEQHSVNAHLIEFRIAAFAAGWRRREIAKTDVEIDARKAVLIPDPNPSPSIGSRLARRWSTDVTMRVPAVGTEVVAESDSGKKDHKKGLKKIGDKLAEIPLARRLWLTNPVAPKKVVYDFKDGQLVSRAELLEGAVAPEISQDSPEKTTRITATERMKRVIFNPWTWKFGTRDGKNKVRMEIEGPVTKEQINHVAQEQLLRAGRDFKVLSVARYIRASVLGFAGTSAVKWAIAPIALAALPATPLLVLPTLPLVGAISVTAAGIAAAAEGLGLGIAVGNITIPILRYWLFGGKREENRWERRFRTLRKDRAHRPLFEVLSK